MRTRNVLLIVVIVIACIGGCAAYILSNPGIEYKNITMNGIQLEVPDGNITPVNQTEHYTIYNDTENDLNIYVFDSEGSNFADLSEMTTFAATREAYQINATSVTKDNVTYNKSESTGICSYTGNYTHKNIIIATSDEDLLIHILNNIKIDEVTANDTNTTNTTNTSSITGSSSSGSDVSVVSSSLEQNYQADDGSTYREVEYSDGNFRQYDTRTGKLIGSSYDSDQSKLADGRGD
ncbi:hypothetical protein [Methanosphaera sp.]